MQAKDCKGGKKLSALKKSAELRTLLADCSARDSRHLKQIYQS